MKFVENTGKLTTKVQANYLIKIWECRIRYSESYSKFFCNEMCKSENTMQLKKDLRC